MKPPIRQIVGKIIGQSIPPDKWYETIMELDRQGRIDNKTVVRILIELCERIEEYESKNSVI